MTDLIQLVHALRRPSLLLRAARHGLQDYNRDRALKRLTRSQPVPSPKRAVSSLLSVEATLEEARQSGDASYNVSRHVDVMIALIAETRLLARPQV
jgi:hypothetical protein